MGIVQAIEKTVALTFSCTTHVMTSAILSCCPADVAYNAIPKDFRKSFDYWSVFKDMTGTLFLVVEGGPIYALFKL